jgi:hypothetical protein
MKITRHSLKNFALSTTVAALIFGVTCSSTQASKPISHRLHWPDPTKMDRRKLEFCSIKGEQNDEEKSI